MEEAGGLPITQGQPVIQSKTQSQKNKTKQKEYYILWVIEDQEQRDSSKYLKELVFYVRTLQEEARQMMVFLCSPLNQCGQESIF